MMALVIMQTSRFRPIRGRRINFIDKSANVLPIYVSGVGTENDFGWLSSGLGLGASLQITQTITAVNEQVNAVVQADPDAKFGCVDTGFSLGTVTERSCRTPIRVAGGYANEYEYQNRDNTPSQALYQAASFEYYLEHTSLPRPQAPNKRK